MAETLSSTAWSGVVRALKTYDELSTFRTYPNRSGLGELLSRRRKFAVRSASSIGKRCRRQSANCRGHSPPEWVAPQVEIAGRRGLERITTSRRCSPPSMKRALPLGFVPAASSKKDFYKALQQVLQLWADDRLPRPEFPETMASIPDAPYSVRASISSGHGGRRVLVVSSGGPIAVTAQQISCRRLPQPAILHSTCRFEKQQR